MPKCPKCKKDIYSLILVETGKRVVTLEWNEDDEQLEETDEEFESDMKPSRYECPECGKQIISEDTEEAAIKFFTDKKIKATKRKNERRH